MQAVKQQIRKEVQENPSVMPFEVCKRLGVTHNTFMESLGTDMCVPVPVADLTDVWKELTVLEKVTCVTYVSGAVIEYGGRLPRLSKHHGMLNMHQKDISLGGHIFEEEIGNLWLVDKPLFSLQSLSLQIMHKDGTTMLGIYAGRGKDRAILPAAKALFEKLFTHYLDRVKTVHFPRNAAF